MNNLRNKVQLIGNVGIDPEVKDINGTKMARFTLATNESYTNKAGEKIQQTQWHNTVAWGKKAELIERFVQKGKELVLEGKLTSRSYETAEGDKRYVTEIQILDLLFVGGTNM